MRKSSWWGLLAWCGSFVACSVPSSGTPEQVAKQSSGLEEVCRQEWCWNAPNPQGNDLNSVWVIAANDVWAVGDFGTLIHWNGTKWSGEFGGSAAHLNGVWASGSNDVWAVGELGTIVRWNGTAWTRVPSGVDFTLTSVWGSGPGDVWAVGEHGSMLHWNGTAWAAVQPLAGEDFSNDSFEAVSGSGANDVWVVTLNRGALHFNGTQWAWAGRDQLPYAVSINATVTGEVWALTMYGVWRWDGASYWSPITWPSNFAPTRSGLLVRSATDVWVIGAQPALLHWDGSSMSVVAPAATPGVRIKAIGGGRTGPVWAAGARGLALSWDGTSWSGDGTRPASQLNGVWGTTVGDAGVVWAVGSEGSVGLVQQWDGASWSRSTLTRAPLRALWGSSASDVWAVGDDATVLHFDGTHWSGELTPFSRTATSFTNVWGSGPSDVWFVGLNRTYLPYDNVMEFREKGIILHWDGARYVSYETGVDMHLNGVWGSGPNDVWAVGGNYGHGVITHWDGNWWTTVPSPDVHLDAVRGTSSTNVWAVGIYGTTLHWNGTAWSEFPNPLSNTLSYFDDVWTSGPNDVWVAGGGNIPWVSQGTLMHWDGTSWSLAVQGTTPYLTSIWASSPTDVWAMGQWGTILHKAR